MSACIGQPISWLRLETFALDARDPSIRAHLTTCAACARCLDEIRADTVALPPLPVPERVRRWRWLRFATPALALAAAAVIALMWRDDPRRADIAYGVKGVGDVILEVVRERHGIVRDELLSFRTGDRWKVIVTCPPTASAWIAVTVDDGATTDRPLPLANVTCGNRVVLPGAFSITGARPAHVCIHIAADTAPDATAPRACLTLRPE